MAKSPAPILDLVAETDRTDTSDTLVLRIYQTVFESVMSQRLKPGTKLPEAALCELFNAGRTTIQKALQKLAHDHIVDLRPNRGAVVAMPTKEETRQLFEARRALEAAILPLAVKNATKSDIAKLRGMLDEEHKVMHTYQQVEWSRLASNFHLRVAELSHNTLLQRYLSELLSRCSLIVALHEPGGHASCEHDEHTLIVDCIERGDVAGATQAMQAHLSVLEERIELMNGKSDNSLAGMLGMN